MNGERRCGYLWEMRMSDEVLVACYCELIVHCLAADCILEGVEH